MGTANVALLGVNYNDVPSVLLPKQGGGQAQFDETTISSNAAAASDIANGKLAYVNGSLVTGTASGGSDHLTLIGTKNLGTISTSSQTATDTGQSLDVTGFDEYDLLIAICHTTTRVNNRHVATVRLINFSATSDVDIKTATSIASSTAHYKMSSNVLVQRSGTTPYGVYVKAATISTGTPRKLNLTIYQCFNNTSSGAINGTYILDVYGVKLQDIF